MHLRHPQRFEELVQLSGLSQRGLAQQAQVSQAFISLVARGLRGVRPVTAWRMAAALGVHTSELFVPEPRERTLLAPGAEAGRERPGRGRPSAAVSSARGRQPGAVPVPTPSRRPRACSPTRRPLASTPV
ncbi:helix-turn-helix transcriptional regulator [Streptomyces sp. ET3-23]|uniref:helix-turn-helix domain-containing protein n=1 Tax=Streptomyces sp. ET3-23 TaxID=2885643 RepID=UPI001D104F82|nr:helix-turn-helix transcriptional regulator [Streptomyces sp. ET3-23]